MPEPPYSAGNIVPSRPSFPSSLTVSSGNSLASSHFMTLGAISRSANSRTIFFNCSCSSESWKSTGPSTAAQPQLPYRAPQQVVETSDYPILAGAQRVPTREQRSWSSYVCECLAAQTSATTASACAHCSRSTSRCVTNRNSSGPTPPVSTLRPASSHDSSPEVLPVPVMSQSTMLVCTLAGSILKPGTSASPSAR